MKWTPPDAVAMMLVIIILVFVLGGIAIHIIGDEITINEASALQWADLMKVIVGGLIGFIGGSRAAAKDDDDNDDFNIS